MGKVILMSYAERFVKAHGQNATIPRDVPVNTKVSIKRSTRASRDVGMREAYWEGLILADAELKSGEVLEIGTDKYLVQSVNSDPASGEHAFFAAKANSVLQHKRPEETGEIDENNNPVVSWETKNDNVPAYIEVVTYALRQYDPGLLEQTRYLAQVPKSIGAEMLDRFILDGKNLQVVSINDAGLQGISILQLGIDLRGEEDSESSDEETPPDGEED